MTILSPNEMQRYLQQIKLPEVGEQGQVKLTAAKVLCIGAGGLGSPLLFYLAAAGVGHIGIIDNDVVDESNLQRQILYQTGDLGKSKAECAKQRILALNPSVTVTTYCQRLTLENAADYLSQYDIVADCSDNFSTRYLVNDICFHLNKPFVFASVSQFQGQCSLFLGQEGPCFRCVFPQLPPAGLLPNCQEGGVLGVLPGLLGMIQASEIIKWILGLPHLLHTRLLTVDILNMSFREFHFSLAPDCPLCVHALPVQALWPSQHLAIESISPPLLKQQMANHHPLVLLDVRSQQEHEDYHIGGYCIPLPELEQRLCELNPEENIVVYCHSGRRSIAAAQLLREKKFKSVKYLAGGMQAWRQTQ